MKYIPPFDVLLKCFELSGEGPNRRLTGSYEDLLRVVRAVLAVVEVDEGWYLGHYEDVAIAVANDRSLSARLHFIGDGYFEGRLPFPMVVDEHWYLSNNPDVAENLRRGSVASGQEHFETSGYREGRLPFKL